MSLPIAQSEYQELLSDIYAIYQRANEQAQEMASRIKTRSYWEIGKRIVHVEQRHRFRAPYGEQLLANLSKDLSQKYGNGFSVTNLKYMRQFYVSRPIGHTCDQLGWSHQRTLLSIKDGDKRQYYEKQALRNHWSQRELSQVLRKDRIPLEKFEEPSLAQTIEAPAKIEFELGPLNTYRLISSEKISQREATLLIDCGFNIWREVPLRGTSDPKANDIVTSVKSEFGYNFTPAEIKPEQLYTYKAHVERVIDGDTLWCQIDCGFRTWTRQKLRLRGIDAPEIRTNKGQQAKEFVEQRIHQGQAVIIKTYQSDKYDRYLTDVFYSEKGQPPEASDLRFLNQELLDDELAKVWE